MHTYYPPRIFVIQFVLKVLAVSALLPLAVLVFLVVSGNIGTISLLIVLGGTVFYFVVGAALAFLVYTQFLRPRLILSPAGLDYKHGRQHLRAAWADVEAIGDRRTVEKGKIVEGLILRDPAPKPEVPRAPDPYFIASNRFVPLAVIRERWRETPLGQEIRHYAPVLFPPEPS